LYWGFEPLEPPAPSGAKGRAFESRIARYHTFLGLPMKRWTFRRVGE